MNNIVKSIAIISSSLILLCCSCSSPPSEYYDVLIKGTKIVDGTGKAAFTGDVAVKGEKIVALGKLKGAADLEIDGTGLVVCPGFVDSHSHADTSILQFPLAENFIMQGVTMVLAGNCGFSAAPKKDLPFADWLSKVEKTGISINLAQLVGHNAVRELVMGSDFKRHATQNEIEAMKFYVEEAMKSGAFGFSGWHDPGIAEYAALEEVISLAKIVQRYGGLYSPHTRHHQNQWFTNDMEEYGYGIFHAPAGEVIAGRYHGLIEAMEISKKANKIPLLIAHFTPSLKIPQPHPEFLQKAVAEVTLSEIIDKARNDGLNVYYNVIACHYSIGSQQPVIASFFNEELVRPDWLKKMSREDFIEALKSREFRENVKEYIYSGRFKVGMLHPLTDPYWIDCYKILTCKKEEYEGKIFGNICRERSPDNIINAVYHESIELLFEILTADPDATWALVLDKRELPGALPVFLKHPAGMPCIDCGSYPAQIEGNIKPAPIYYGLFPLYIDTFVKKKNTLSLEEAIKKATYVPAQEVLGLKNRGILQPDAYADLVVFDFDKLKMAGDYLNPNVPPDGIKYVFVNGEVVYKDKLHTGIKSGKIIRHSF